MDSQPTKEDIEVVFHRLRAVPANKVCFDCNAKNPTWASVTYGIFICIDCSAVHRSLGVHLSFVRSTQLDTNWTWLQLRQMQVGGNQNAFQFFTQHNCNTTDSQKKYNSRAAHLYREKLLQAALNSSKSNNKVHIPSQQEENVGEKEVDFFSEHESISSKELPGQQVETKDDVAYKNTSHEEKPTIKSTSLEEKPKIDYFLESASETHKSTITSRKTPVKKSVLGARKTGLGAVKVKANFADLEKEAEAAEESRINIVQELAKNKSSLPTSESDESDATIRLVYRELEIEQQKQKNQLKSQDPKKAEQLERLGMGIKSRTGVSHSAVNDMQTIEQENVLSTTNTLSSLGKLRVSDDSFFDDYPYGKSSFSMNRNTAKDYSKDESSLFESTTSRDSWVIVNDPLEKPKSKSSLFGKPEEKSVRSLDTASDDKAQKTFGNAKAISSEQFFHDEGKDFEAKANLSRFQGSSSISSADFFGTDSGNVNNAAYDIEDVKESVRQGVTKVAGKLGSIANGLMSSIQDRYGY